MNEHEILESPLLVVVGSGGVGKTTVAAALGLLSASQGKDTLVMTFDPSRRLKDALGVGDAAEDCEVRVESDTPGRLHASLLDAKRTFDRLIRHYSPNEEAAERLLSNGFYQHLAGTLGGVLEYMAVERLYEVAAKGGYERIILDTPPTRQALDFLEAPERMMGFLDSGALRIALKSWFDDTGQLRATSKWGFVGKGVEAFFDRIIGLDLLRDFAEFFQAFGPLYDGFGERALAVQELLRCKRTLFALVAGPGEEKIPDTLFFARRLEASGHRLGPVIVNRVHPTIDPSGDDADELFAWLGQRDHHGLRSLSALLPDRDLLALPLQENEPTDLKSLAELGWQIEQCLGVPVSAF